MSNSMWEGIPEPFLRKDEWGEFDERDVAAAAERIRKAIDHSIMESLLPPNAFARRPLGIADSVAIKTSGRYIDRNIKSKLAFVAEYQGIPQTEWEDFFNWIQRKLPPSYLRQASPEDIIKYMGDAQHNKRTQDPKQRRIIDIKTSSIKGRHAEVTIIDESILEEEADDMPLKEQVRVKLDPIFAKAPDPITLEEIIQAEPRIATVLNQALQLRHHADKAKVHKILMDALDPLIGERSDTFILQSPEATMVVIKAVRQRCGCGG